ncbi:MAG: CDP-diacylglycerol--serine O-phosphatidyltransferase [Burkholderiaceae bacterium]|nr:CDP-diacylglycerol--serine O-phosphatidyltransferase [Burkholderiaceae bacterium]
MRFRRRKPRPYVRPALPVAEDLAVRPALRRRGIYLLPNLFTMAALFAGFFAIVQAMNQRFEVAAIAIFVAMVLDGMDGRVARLTNTQSAFGEQLDSLSDMTSFGVAPALVMYEWILSGLGRWGWAGAFVYCACAAARLARFNANLGVVDACRARRRRRWWPASSGWRSTTSSTSRTRRCRGSPSASPSTPA